MRNLMINIGCFRILVFIFKNTNLNCKNQTQHELTSTSWVDILDNYNEK